MHSAPYTLSQVPLISFVAAAAVIDVAIEVVARVVEVAVDVVVVEVVGSCSVADKADFVTIFTVSFARAVGAAVANTPRPAMHASV